MQRIWRWADLSFLYEFKCSLKKNSNEKEHHPAVLLAQEEMKSFSRIRISSGANLRPVINGGGKKRAPAGHSCVACVTIQCKNVFNISSQTLKCGKNPPDFYKQVSAETWQTPDILFVVLETDSVTKVAFTASTSLEQTPSTRINKLIMMWSTERRAGAAFTVHRPLSLTRSSSSWTSLLFNSL